MNVRMLRRIVPALAVSAQFASAPAGVASAAEPIHVTFRSADADRTRLDGYLFRPAGKGPFPAVIALHGCNGLLRGPSPGALSDRDRDWAERLVDDGYVVLFPDSFGPRDVKSVCKIREQRPVPPPQRADDARGAAAWLARRSYVDRERLAVLGWSHGGTSVLWIARAEAASGRPRFQAAVAFYPACRIFAERKTWRPELPVTILIGGADDWTPAAPCRELAAKHPQIRLVEYPDAHHGFDAPARPLTRHTGLAFTAGGRGAAHVGTDPEARRAAIREVKRVLKEALK